MNETKQILRSLKIKATPGRVKILQVLSSAKRPVCIKDIGKAIGLKAVDQATIYRNLEIFRNLGLAKRVDFRKEQAYYELVGPDHHHLVCTRCGLVEKFTGCNFGAISKAALKQSRRFSQINEHSLELFGLCKSCSK